MKLVIDIDDKTYRTIKDGLFLIKGGRGSGRIMEYNALKAIYDGMPLSSIRDDIRAEITDFQSPLMINVVDADGAVDACLVTIDKYIGEE